jgi:hypothetical protein
MGTGDLKVHDKDRALFDRIDATLAAYDEHRTTPVPGYLETYARELDDIHRQIVSARRAQR